MSKLWAVVVLVLLRLGCGFCCPDLCQCFSAAKVICSDDKMSALPLNISAEVRELIVVASGVTHLDAQSFREKLRLTKLVVLNSLVKVVSHEAFDRTPELQELEISGNLVWLSFNLQTFSSLHNLTRLLLNNNRISGLEAGVFDSLQNLEALQLRGNSLPSLPTRLFHRLHKLQELDLSFNQISAITGEVFHNNSLLRALSLQANAISQLPDGLFTHLDHLEELNLRGNHISQLSPGTFPLGLKKLILKKNALAQLQSAIFHKLHLVTYLDLSQNQISEVHSDLFQSLISLKKLDLSENRISALPGTVFKGLLSVKAIDLQKNILSSLDANLLDDQHNMEQLYLSMNKLLSIPDGFFDDLDFQCVVQLHGNPWRCDCGIQYFSDWLRFNHRNVEDLSRVYCEAPESVRGHSLPSVTDQLVCVNGSSAKPHDSSGSEATEISADGSDDATVRCSLREVKGIASIQCNVTKCTSVKFLAQFEFVNASHAERVVSGEWPAPTSCSNGTV